MHSAIRISAADGYALGGTVFDGGRGPVVVVNGALGVRQRYYGKFAAWLAGQGATVITYDYRGIGESKPHKLRGYDARARDWGQQDFEGVLRYAAEAYPGRTLAVVGHSIGGQLIGLAPSARKLSRVFTVSSQSGYWRHWPQPTQWVIAGLMFGVVPLTASVMGYVPGKWGIGEDVPSGVAREWASWCRSAGYFGDHGVSTEGFAQVKGRVLALSLSDDWYSPRKAVDWLHRLYANAQVERRHVSPGDVGVKAIGHFGFFREAYRESLWEVARSFLLEEPPVQVRQAAPENRASA